MRGATLIYNGVSIALTKTNSITAKPVMSKDGVNYLYTEYTINIDGILNPQETAYASNPPEQIAGVIAPQTYTSIRHALEQPRGSLSFKGAGVNVFLSPAAGNITDVNNGPIPGPLTITRFAGYETWHINYTITVCLIECPSNNNIALLSNRFSQTHSIDQNFYTTVTTKGVAYFRTDILTRLDKSADELRSILFPPIPPAFRRMEIRVGMNSENNAIEYEIIDREQSLDIGDTNANGTFITNVEGFYNASTISAPDSGMPSGMSMVTMNVKLWGSRNANVWNMTQLAFSIMSSKMPIGLPNTALVHNFSATQDLKERFVDVTLSMRVSAPVGGGKFGQIRTGGLAVWDWLPGKNGFNPAPPTDNGTRGTANLVILRNAIEEACSQPPPPDALSASGSGGMAPAPVSGPTPAITVYPANIVPDSNNRYNSDNDQYPYSQAYIEMKFDTTNGSYQAPIGASLSGSQTCSIVNLHEPYTRLIVDWTAERFFQPPKLPSFVSSDPNRVLLSHTINPAEIALMPDGVTQNFRVRGRYVYALKNALGSTNGPSEIPFAIPQWMNYPYGQAKVQMPPYGADSGGNFFHGIIDQGLS